MRFVAITFPGTSTGHNMKFVRRYLAEIGCTDLTIVPSDGKHLARCNVPGERLLDLDEEMRVKRNFYVIRPPHDPR